MKHTITIITVACALIGARPVAAEPPPVKASVDKRFQEANIRWALKKYRQLLAEEHALITKYHILDAPNGQERDQYFKACQELELRMKILRESTISRDKYFAEHTE